MRSVPVCMKSMLKCQVSSVSLPYRNCNLALNIDESVAISLRITATEYLYYMAILVNMGFGYILCISKQA